MFLYTLFIRLLQLFFLSTPILSMFWRGVAFKLFNIVRGIIRIVKFCLLAVWPSSSSKTQSELPEKKQKGKGKDNEKGAVAAAGPQTTPKPLVALFKALDFIDLCCIHARGLMQTLTGFVKLSPLHSGATDTLIYYCETEYHMIFSVMYFVTMYLSAKTTKSYGTILKYTVAIFQYSDLLKNMAWCYFFFMQYCEAMGRSSSSSFGANTVHLLLDDFSSNGYSFDFNSYASGGEEAAHRMLLVKSLCGVVVTCMDMYCGYFAGHTVHPLTISVVQIISATYYIAVSFI